MCFPVCVLIVWLVLCLLVSVFLVVCSCFRSCVLLVLVVVFGLRVSLDWLCVSSGLVRVSVIVSGLCILAFPSGRVVLFFSIRPVSCCVVLPVFCLACSRLSFLRLLFFFGVFFFCVSRSAGAVRPACAPCGARAFPFPLVFPYRRPRARRRMMRMPRYSPRAKRRMACTASRRPCARPARVVPAGEAGRRAGRRVSSGSGVVSGV